MSDLKTAFAEYWAAFAEATSRDQGDRKEGKDSPLRTPSEGGPTRPRERERARDADRSTRGAVTVGDRSPRRSRRGAEAAFRTRVAALGGTVIEPSWLGVHHPHQAICAAGHECAPYPSGLAAGEGMCRTCTGRDPRVAEAAFRERVAALGGTVVESTWRGSKRPHRVICAEGHECAPSPNAVQQGEGLCRKCAGKIWDHFYVVVDPAASRVKFGITSGDARPRLDNHRRAGYGGVLRSFEVTDADELERAVLATLRLAEIPPVQGREHYDRGALPVILDVVDNWEGEEK